MCAGGRRPAREPSALLASLGASSRSPARPRRRPPAPPQVPPAPFTPVMPGHWRVARRLEARPGPAAAHGHRGRSLRCPSHLWGWVADVWLGASSRSPARPRRRPPAPPQVPPAPFTPVMPGHWRVVGRVVSTPGPAFTPQASCSPLAHIAAESTPNFARNSPVTLSNSEFRSLELQHFRTLLKLCPIELRARFRGRGSSPQWCATWCIACFLVQGVAGLKPLSPLRPGLRAWVKPPSPLLA